MRASLPVHSADGTTSASASCPADDRPRAVTATCQYASGLTATSSAACDGRVSSVSYQCPTLPRCAHWNSTSQAWSHSGCKTISLSRSGSRALLTCHCRLLGSFSATAHHAERSIVSLSLQESGRGRERKRTYVLLVLLVVVYSSLILALLFLRLRRATQSLAYLR